MQRLHAEGQPTPHGNNGAFRRGIFEDADIKHVPDPSLRLNKPGLVKGAMLQTIGRRVTESKCLHVEMMTVELNSSPVLNCSACCGRRR